LLDALPAHDARADPELQLLAVEELRSIVGALPTLALSERRALARTLAGETYGCLAQEFGTRKAARRPSFAGSASSRPPYPEPRDNVRGPSVCDETANTSSGECLRSARTRTLTETAPSGAERGSGTVQGRTARRPCTEQR